MSLYLYRIIHEVGFAPNFAGGVWTMLTCKPVIRRKAEPDDYVVGVLPKEFNYEPVFIARITDKMTIGEYWNHSDYQYKKPTTEHFWGLYGDNAYEPLPDGTFRQHPCNHSLPRWTTNEDERHKARDTSGLFVLISTEFIAGTEDAPLHASPGLLFDVLGAHENIRGHRVYPGSVGRELWNDIEDNLVNI